MPYFPGEFPTCLYPAASPVLGCTAPQNVHFGVQLGAGASIPGTDPPREPPTPAHRAQREARRRPGVIEPGSFIYTVKVTSNFLRLSCSSAIKSWRGYKSAVFSPARGEGSLQRRGHLRQPVPGGAHSPLRLCK